MLEGITTVFFDLGATLVDESRVWQARCREQAAMAQAKKKHIKSIALQLEMVKASANLLPPWRTALARYGLSEEAPYRAEHERLYPDAGRVLSALGGRYTLGVIANQKEGLSARLEEFGIAKYFSFIISSWDAKCAKPDPQIFSLALEKAGCRAENAVMIGDRLDNDIFPAKSLGMKTIWIRQELGGIQTPKDDRYVPDARIDSLSEILNIL